MCSSSRCQRRSVQLIRLLSRSVVLCPMGFMLVCLCIAAETSPVNFWLGAGQGIEAQLSLPFWADVEILWPGCSKLALPACYTTQSSQQQALPPGPARTAAPRGGGCPHPGGTSAPSVMSVRSLQGQAPSEGPSCCRPSPQPFP